MFKPLLWTCGFWLCSLLALPSYANEVVIYADEDYPPIMYRDTQGQARGVMADAVRNFEKHSAQTIKLEPTSWRRAYEYAARGKGGIIGLSKTKERLAIFDYSDVIFEDNVYLAVRRGKEFDFKTLSDLRNKLIGMHLGASYGDIVDNAIKEGVFQVDLSTTDAIRIRKLLRGRLDAAIVSNGQIGLDAILKTDPELLANRSEFVVLATPLVRDPLHLGFAKSMKMTSFLREFNQSLKTNKTPLLVNKQ